MWPDGVYPYRIRVTFLGVPQVSVPMKPLVPRLSFIRPDAGPAWGTYLQTSQRTIPWEDFAFLRNAIDQARLPSSN
jgi:predicted RNA-binding protein